jgi:hypothetical protein
MPLSRLSLVVPVMLLSGCLFIPIPAPPGAPGSVMIVPADPCGARSVSAYRGVTESDLRSTNFAAPGPIRILQPGESPGAERIENRLTFTIGTDGRVASITCG